MVTPTVPTLFELADFEPKPVYAGIAPLHFTTDYFHPDDLAAADHWLRNVEGLHYGSAVGRIHTWRRGVTTGWVVPEGADLHNLCLLTCCLSCFDYPAHDIDRSREHGETLRTCSCIQLNLDQAVCTACSWHHIGATETECVEAWLDANYPAEFRVAGASILTLRAAHSTRHVPGYSPYGGFDLAANNLPGRDTEH